MVNSGQKIGIASNRDVSYLHSMMRPLGVQFKEKNGEETVIWQLYQTIPNPNPKVISASISKEKVILDEYENGVEHFYIIKYAQLANFFHYEFQKIMPFVNPITVTKLSSGNNTKEGDRIKISGDGCTEDKVYIYISPNAHPNIKYLVARVPSVLGKWSC
jgi:hypothetical protein